jgi:hypothetical protein
VLSSSGFKLGSGYWLLVLFVARNPYLCNIKPSITSMIAAMAVPTPIPALAPVEIPEWEGSGGDVAGVGALVGADETATEPAVADDIDTLLFMVWLGEVEFSVDALEGTDVCARDVGLYIGVT